MDVSVARISVILARGCPDTHLDILERNPLQRILFEQPVEQIDHVTRLLRQLPMRTLEVAFPAARRHLIRAHRLWDLEILVRDHLEQLKLARRVERDLGEQEAVERDA